MNSKGCIINEITPLSEKDCFYIADRRKTEFTYPLHHHFEYELNYIENASGVKRIVGDSVEIIGDYDLTLITGEELEHVWEQHECQSMNIREITIQFSSSLFADGLFRKNQFDSIRKMFEKAKKGLNFPMEAIMKVYGLLDSLSSESEGFYAVLKFLSILYELSLFDDVRMLASSSFANIDDSNESRRVQKISEYVNAHYKDNIHLEELANLVGMAPESLSRFFKIRSGKTVSEYIIDIRLGYAARQLADTTNSISEVCYDCGFNNLSNFNRIFKKKKGCTPKEFRENFRKTKVIV
jgi:AraC-like DNA-binding protein